MRVDMSREIEEVMQTINGVQDDVNSFMTSIEGLLNKVLRSVRVVAYFVCGLCVVAALCLLVVTFT